MARSLAAESLSIVLLGTLLVGCPLAAGMSVCLEGGAAPGCCRGSGDSRGSVAPSQQELLDGGGCGCCVAVDAMPSNLGTSSHKSFLDARVGPAFSRNGVTPSCARVPGTAMHDRSDRSLSSLRTVILLI